jgi:hypothetical protein
VKAFDVLDEAAGASVCELTDNASPISAFPSGKLQAGKVLENFPSVRLSLDILEERKWKITAATQASRLLQ